MSNLSPTLRQRFIGTDGLPVALGKLYSYVANSSTPKLTYADRDEGVANDNPLILDANGEGSVWISVNPYRLVLKTAANVTVWDVDNVTYLADGEITTNKIQNGAATTGKFAADSATTAKFENLSITAAKIVDGAIIPEKIPDESIDVDKLSTSIDLTDLGETINIASDLNGNLVIPQWDWSTPVKVTDPNVLPTSAGNAVAWSPNCEYLAVSLASTPFLAIYQRSGTTFIKVTNPVSLPASAATDVSWSRDGRYLAFAHSTTPFFTVYERSESTFTKLADPVLHELPPKACLKVDFSPDAKLLAVQSTVSAAPAGASTSIYEINGGVLSRIELLLETIGGSAGIAWSSQSKYFATTDVLHGNVILWRRNADDSFTRASVTTTGTAFPTAAAWSLDGQFLAFTRVLSPILIFQKIQSGNSFTFTLLPIPANTPTGQANDLCWSKDGQYLAIALNTSPFLLVYSRVDLTFTKLANVSALPAGSANGVAFSPDNRFLAVAHATSPFITIYQTGSTFPTNALLYAKEITHG